MAQYDRMLELYQSGSVPWDQADPPPEVLAFAPTLPIGRALDLGSGLGRATIYLAGLGWEVDSVDFVPQAIAQASERAQQAGVADRAHFHLAPVEQLDFLAGPYDFAVDVGCAHNFSVEQLRQYHRDLRRLLRHDGWYLLFAHLTEGDVEPEHRRWVDEAVVRDLFADGFVLERVEHGETQVGDQAPWRSAWFWYRRDAS